MKNEEIIAILEQRFKANTKRHPDLDWADVERKLKGSPDKLEAIMSMEQTGGEPDVISYNDKSAEFLFVDCSKESPKVRRNLCYDMDARINRKKFPPESSALEMAAKMGVEILGVDDYALLQTSGRYDTKTSSWLLTPEKIRKLGGAIFGDCRYDTVFTYHNGADSYYGARGFRAKVKI